MSKRIVEMSVSEFCDYVSANPGGARKAYEIRKEGGGDMGEGGVKEKVVEKVIYKDKVVEKVVYKDRVKRVEVPKEVVREVEVVKVERKNSLFLRVSTGVFLGLSLLSMMAYAGKDVNPVSYVDREVEVVKTVEKVVEKPVEVIKEVIREVRVEVPVIKEVVVSDEYTETTLRREIARRDEEIDRLHRERGNRGRQRTGSLIGSVLNEVLR